MRFGKNIIPNDFMRQLLMLCVRWYSISGNECGGDLHVVLDDDNIDNDTIECCRKHMKKNNNKNITIGNTILDGLASIGEQQRRWVTYNIYSMKDEGREREVLEEFED